LSDTEVVAKVRDLMRTLDDVKRYSELAHAIVDFAGIVLVSLIAGAILVIIQDSLDIVAGPPSNNGLVFPVSLNGFPVNPIIGSGIVLMAILGPVLGILWVARRVGRTKKGEWEDTLKEGVPGAVKLLTETDWDSQLSTINLAKTAYLLYGLIKVLAYSVLLFIVLFIAGSLSGFWFALNTTAIAAVSVVVALIFTRKSLAEGFRRLQALDGLFWDLRWFYSEFKRAEFNQA